MKKKHLPIFILTSLLLTIAPLAASLSPHLSASAKDAAPSSNSLQPAINRPLIEQNITVVEKSNDDVTYCILGIFDSTLTTAQKEEFTKTIQNKIRGLEADILDINRSIRIDDYNCQTCQLLTTLSIALQHNRNAMNEILLYLNATTTVQKLESLERFFYAKNASYENLDQVKRTLDSL